MIHPIDVIQHKRDGLALSDDEIQAFIRALVRRSSPADTPTDAQTAALLMAIFLRGLNSRELAALTQAMRFSGEVFNPAPLQAFTVDKHSTGGVGDKTSMLIAPIVAASGLKDPMISGRSLGHTGGTLDKLETIPGFRTQLSLSEFLAVIQQCGFAMAGQTPSLVPADRILYALRDHTGTVESPYLITASIMSKKLAAGLNALVLDVKTGSGAFLRRRADAEFLAALMVATAEAAGTRTVALMTDMGQPLGRTAGNWIEVAECVEILRGTTPEGSEDLRELSLRLAGWMIHLGGKTRTAEQGYWAAAGALTDGTALKVFLEMVKAQGGDLAVFDDVKASHKPGAVLELKAWRSGYVAAMDTMELGWAVQRLGAGREKAGEPVDPHAGIEFYAKRGAHVTKGQPFATLYATNEAMLAEPVERIKGAVTFATAPPENGVPLVSHVFVRENAEAYLRDAVR